MSIIIYVSFKIKDRYKDPLMSAFRNQLYLSINMLTLNLFFDITYSSADC